MLSFAPSFSVGYAQEETDAKRRNPMGQKPDSAWGVCRWWPMTPDIGFKYGALVNLYWYGDGSRYPRYDHSVYVEWSRTTKGNGINQITYDTDKLIPGVRAFFEASLTEKALDFYGFNGYESAYSMDFEKNQLDLDGNANRLYYRHARQLARVKADFQ
ncbi:MAG: hypothetical protein R2751_12790 [Bacteroidales bacterium]